MASTSLRNWKKYIGGLFSELIFQEFWRKEREIKNKMSLNSMIYHFSQKTILSGKPETVYRSISPNYEVICFFDNTYWLLAFIVSEIK